MAMGYSQERALSDNPMIRELYDSYCLCRAQQFVHFRRPEGRDGKEKLVSVVFTTGLSLLPREGGVDEQNYVHMRIFAAFLRGEREGQLRLMQR